MACPGFHAGKLDSTQLALPQHLHLHLNILCLPILLPEYLYVFRAAPHMVVLGACAPAHPPLLPHPCTPPTPQERLWKQAAAQRISHEAARFSHSKLKRVQTTETLFFEWTAKEVRGMKEDAKKGNTPAASGGGAALGPGALPNGGGGWEVPCACALLQGLFMFAVGASGCL